MSQNWRVGFDPASGTSIGWTLARSRLRRLAEESSGRLDEGRKADDPGGDLYPGRPGSPVSGLGFLALTLAPLEVIGNRIGGSSLVNAAFIAAARSDVSADLKSRHPYRSRLLASVLGWGDLRSDAAARDFASTRPFVSLWPLGSGHQVTGGEGHD
jgi:hypothetical protein